MKYKTLAYHFIMNLAFLFIQLKYFLRCYDSPIIPAEIIKHGKQGIYE